MPFFDKYPYTNFHNVNLDWVLERVKEWGELVEQNNTAFHELEEANASFKRYVETYLENLDIQDEINIKMDALLESGVLTEYLQPYIIEDVSAWLEEHITEPTGVVIDTSLTISGACADAKATGQRITSLENSMASYVISNKAKSFLISALKDVTFNSRNGQKYVEALENEIYGSSLVISFTQSVIFDFNTNLNALKSGLTVKYIDDNGNINEINDYELSGVINSEISEITVTYNSSVGKFKVGGAPANRWINNVLTISKNELRFGNYLASSPETGYTNGMETRFLYLGLQIDFNQNYKYTIRCNTTYSNIQVACRTMPISAIDLYVNNLPLGSSDDSGWQSNGYVFNANGNVTNEQCAFLIIPIRKSDNSNLSLANITNVTITRSLRS